jgi:hypothetical protein
MWAKSRGYRGGKVGPVNLGGRGVDDRNVGCMVGDQIPVRRVAWGEGNHPGFFKRGVRRFKLKTQVGRRVLREALCGFVACVSDGRFIVNRNGATSATG